MNIKGQNSIKRFKMIFVVTNTNVRINPIRAHNGRAKRAHFSQNSVLLNRITRGLITQIAMADLWATGASTMYKPSANAAVKHVTDVVAKYQAAKK
jgi:hypothetical protein